MTEVKGLGGRRRRRYWELKEEAEDRKEKLK
jgi:hypothetical protein